MCICKDPFPNKAPFRGSGDLNVDMSFEGTSITHYKYLLKFVL